MKRPLKYRNTPTELAGIRFQSKAESRAWAVLKVREKAGEISDLECQPEFTLRVNDIKICTYRGDFRFWDKRNLVWRIVDVKGVETAVFKLKRRLMKACLGIEVETWRPGDEAT